MENRSEAVKYAAYKRRSFLIGRVQYEENLVYFAFHEKTNVKRNSLNDFKENTLTIHLNISFEREFKHAFQKNVFEFTL